MYALRQYIIAAVRAWGHLRLPFGSGKYLLRGIFFLYCHFTTFLPAFPISRAPPRLHLPTLIYQFPPTTPFLSSRFRWRRRRDRRRPPGRLPRRPFVAPSGQIPPLRYSLRLLSAFRRDNFGISFSPVRRCRVVCRDRRCYCGRFAGIYLRVLMGRWAGADIRLQIHYGT